MNRLRLRRRRGRREVRQYRTLVQREQRMLGQLGPALAERLASMTRAPLVSIIWLPEGDLAAPTTQTVAALQQQTFRHWEVLCDVAASPEISEPRLRQLALPDTEAAALSTAQRFNRMLAAARGDYVMLLRGRDSLVAPHGLLLLAESAERFDRPPLVYADEDSIDRQGQRHTPQFKCAWNQELQRSTHYLGRAYLVRADHARRAGGLAELPLPEAEQVLALTVSEQRPDLPAVHVPHLLYSRFAEADQATDSEALHVGTAELSAAVAAHVRRCGQRASVAPGSEGGLHVRYAVPEPAPLVSLIVPTRNGLALLQQCIESVLRLTTYPNYEVLVVDNGSDDPATLAYLRDVVADPRIRVRRDDRPFNFSALNNHALPECRGSVIGLLNNDTEVISPDWLDEMVGLACRDDVGAVGARLWFSNRTLQHAGVLLGIGGAAGHAHLGLTRDDPGYLGRARLAQEFSAITAACMLMRRSVFESVGGLDEQNLAIDLNDIDLCLKIRSAGLRVVWTPFAELFHHESATRGKPQRPEQEARYQAERRCFRERWHAWLGADPAYNPNLTLGGDMFSLPSQPRLGLERPWFEQRLQAAPVPLL